MSDKMAIAMIMIMLALISSHLQDIKKQMNTLIETIQLVEKEQK